MEEIEDNGMIVPNGDTGTNTVPTFEGLQGMTLWQTNPETTREQLTQEDFNKKWKDFCETENLYQYEDVYRYTLLTHLQAREKGQLKSETTHEHYIHYNAKLCSFSCRCGFFVSVNKCRGHSTICNAVYYWPEGYQDRVEEYADNTPYRNELYIAFHLLMNEPCRTPDKQDWRSSLL